MKIMVKFNLQVNNVFHFQDGSTVFVGTLRGNAKIVFPFKVQIIVDGQSLGEIMLHGQRMSGNKLSSDQLIVFTRDQFSLAAQGIQGKNCMLVNTPES